MTAIALLAVATGLCALGARIADRRAAVPGRDAPEKALKNPPKDNWRESVVVGRTVTVQRPRREVYDAWRDFAGLPRFLENVEKIDVLDPQRARWTVAAPAGTTVDFVSIITEDRPGEVIAWMSEAGSDIRNSGRVVFRDAPGGRGTEVDATIAYDPPAGRIGQLVAKVFQHEPAIQTRRDLKRFKQWMETGEVAVASSHPPKS
ncbi:SRPBCC family protein [Methylobrevis pamukkalensis]|uniref:Polyketide cyclase / dehydrase and lipid transport n=1 Tax=Methylobrevis pamukkalensis TaxID=1439726 RepID=A0A1E3GWQ4_9HYPH|nr:SRPBCC family protein [Methylobrevis pamukkalensis]ODN68487.1 Polyketide cyclase / dehydrase and lipid transport [Methylobrevis pamukkalensis]